MGKEISRGAWISIILRVSIASLFGAAAIAKFLGGLDGVVMYIENTFKATWLPMPLVSLYAHLLPFAEALIAIWLIAGCCLEQAWIFTAFVTVSLAFGMVVSQNVAAANVYFYVFLCCVGLHFSQYDTWTFDSKKRKK